MDIDGWEILSDDGFHDFNEDDSDDENHIFLGKKNNDSRSVFDNYFCTSPKSSKNIEASTNHSQRVPNQLVHVLMQLEPIIQNPSDDVLVEQNIIDHVELTTEKINVSHDEDTVSSHVFFKMNENEFMKKEMESPKSNTRVMFTQLDVGSLKFEDKGEAIEIMNSSPRMKVENEMVSMECVKEEDGFNFWKWGFSGFGSVCTIGVVVAAATICVLFYGSKHKKKLQQHHKIQFQIYTDDKRIKQVVQRATKLNEAISVAARGVPLSRAHITYGGYYDAL